MHLDFKIFSKTPDVSNEQPCFKTTRLFDDLLSSLFHFFCFIFSAPISFSLCFPISPSLLLFFFDFFSQVFIKCSRKALVYISSVQSLSRVRLFATPRIAARQASLCITNSRSSLKLTCIESVMPSSHLILCRPLLLLPPILPASESFPMSQLFA